MSALVYATRAYEGFADALAKAGGFERGKIETRLFPDDERYLRVCGDVDGKDAVLVGGTISDEDTLELFDLACGIVQLDAKRLSLVIPYFGHSTMERAVRSGEVVTAKTRARLLSAIPVPGSGLRVYLLDLHAEGIPYYFEGAIRPTHLYGKRLVIDAARAMYGDDFVIASTDAGRAKWVESLANDLQVPASFVYKRRTSGSAVQVTGVSAQVAGRNVVIYDDMIRTGGSLLKAAQAYRDAGAKEISAIATHGVFPGDSLEKLRMSGLFRKLVVTDSHPRASTFADGFLEVKSVAPLFVQALRTGGAP